MKRILSELRIYVCNYIITIIPSHHIRLAFYRTFMRFSIGAGSYIFMRCRFDCAENITIGKHSVINANCRIDPRGGVWIGENVSISNDVIILTADHDITTPGMDGRERKVVINDYVWIGTRAMIMPGVSIGRGAVIAAGAVVTKSVTPYGVVAGVPARVINERTIKDNYTYTASFKRLFQ